MNPFRNKFLLKGISSEKIPLKINPFRKKSLQKLISSEGI